MNHVSHDLSKRERGGSLELTTKSIVVTNLKQEDEIRDCRRKTWICILNLLVRIADVGISGLALHKEDVTDLKNRAIRQIASVSYFVFHEGLSIYQKGKPRTLSATFTLL